MSHKTDSSPGGLFSRMVRFVRSPSQWSEEAQESSKESQYSKQMLKEMIERKRRNDFVRKREFDQLRKLRQRDTSSSPSLLDDPAARPSFFQSSLTMPEDRAGTIKKIDEIEAQMSMQWWKSNAPEASTTQPSQFPDSTAPASSPGVAFTSGPAPAEAMQSASFADTGGPASTNFAVTAPLSLPVHLAPQDAAPVMAMDLLGGNGLPDPVGAPTAIPATAAQEAPPFLHDQDLEEAAILFANGDIDGAELSLKGLLVGLSADDPVALERWMALFDLYRATGREAPFEDLSIEFAARFGRSAPLWYSLPDLLGVQAEEDDKPRRDFQWVSPAALLLPSVEHLVGSAARATSPWTLSWARLSRIDPGAFKALGDAFTQWAEQAVHIQMVDVERLMNALMDATPSGDSARSMEAWRTRMALLRLMGRMDEFEMVALDFCVTYEVSPPSWIEPRCQCVDAQAPEEDSGAATEQPTSVSVKGLEGVVLGDATDMLAQCDAQAPTSGALVLSCERVIRVDFSAAGSILNWAAQQQQQQRQVVFQGMHRLVAVFFNVVGINEHARIVPRKD